MGPGPDEALARYGQSLEKAGNCILVGIGPAADGVHGTLDRRVILAYRSVLPISIMSLVLQPKFQEQRYVRQALQPHRPPGIAPQGRDRAAGTLSRKGTSPTQVRRPQAACRPCNAHRPRIDRRSSRW